MPSLTKVERERRDALIINLFLSGQRESVIARRVNLSAKRVHQIVDEQLAIASERFGLISQKALVVSNERLEMLLKGIWNKAVSGEDTKATEVARRLLEQQAKLYNIAADVPTRFAPMGDNELTDEVDDLRKYRARHHPQEASTA